MIEPARWIADALVLFGLAVMSLAVLGLLRFSDLYLRLHAAGKAVVLGTVPILLATIGSGDPAMIGRAGLVAAFLLLTAPVSAHAIGRAAYVRRLRVADRRGGSPAAPLGAPAGASRGSPPPV
jgi:multicomponent Na+:H+ antiporter subunit G